MQRGMAYCTESKELKFKEKDRRQKTEGERKIKRTKNRKVK